MAHATKVTPAIMHSLSGGDLGATTLMLTRMSAVSALLEFFLNPIFGALSDSWGRLPFLYLSPAATLLFRALVAWKPTSAGVFVGQVCCAEKSMLRNQC